MNVFLLGAGRPAHGKKPSALKYIARNTKAMDWQLHSFEEVTSLDEIHYLGGYHVSEVIKSYPKINYTVIPDWDSQSVLHTLFKAPFSSGRPALIAYSDTLFRKKSVSEVANVEADVVFCVDSSWKQRYETRLDEDILAAETIEIDTPEVNVR